MKKKALFLLTLALVVMMTSISCNMGNTDSKVVSLSIDGFKNSYALTDHPYTMSDYEVHAISSNGSYQIVTDKATISVNGTAVPNNAVEFAKDGTGNNVFNLSASYGGKTTTKAIEAYGPGDLISFSARSKFLAGSTLKDFITRLEYLRKDGTRVVTSGIKPDTATIFVLNLDETTETPLPINLNEYKVRENDWLLLYYTYYNDNGVTSEPAILELTILSPTDADEARVGLLSPYPTAGAQWDDWKPRNLTMALRKDGETIGRLSVTDDVGDLQADFAYRVTIGDTNTPASGVITAGRYKITVTYTYTPQSGSPTLITAVKTFAVGNP
jgi:hypothetical protein